MSNIKTRQELRSTFSTGKIPTEEDFADLFESSLNRKDDDHMFAELKAKDDKNSEDIVTLNQKISTVSSLCATKDFTNANILTFVSCVSTANIVSIGAIAISQIDGYTLANDNLFLAAGQAIASENGVYEYKAGTSTKLGIQPKQAYILNGITNKDKIFTNTIGNTWVSPASTSGNTVGDLKYSTQKNDHNGWLICNGRLLSQTMYTSLYAIIGNAYGSTAASGTFNLPNATGRVLAASSTSSVAGLSVGADSMVLSESQLPAHNHGVGTLAPDMQGEHTHTATTSAGANDIGGGTRFGWMVPTGQIITSKSGKHTHTISGATGFTGIGSAIDNRQKTLYIDNVFIYAG